MGQKLSFVLLFQVLLMEMKMQGKSNPFPSFHCGNVFLKQEIFEVNVNKDIEDIDFCDFLLETLPTQAPPKNRRLYLP